VTSPDNIENGEWVQREASVALKIESVSVTSPDNIANGVWVQREVTVALNIGSVRVDLT
jgi:hypothetical protein